MWNRSPTLAAVAAVVVALEDDHSLLRVFNVPLPCPLVFEKYFPVECIPGNVLELDHTWATARQPTHNRYFYRQIGKVCLPNNPDQGRRRAAAVALPLWLRLGLVRPVLPATTTNAEGKVEAVKNEGKVQESLVLGQIQIQIQTNTTKSHRCMPSTLFIQGQALLNILTELANEETDDP